MQDGYVFPGKQDLLQVIIAVNTDLGNIVFLRKYFFEAFAALLLCVPALLLPPVVPVRRGASGFWLARKRWNAPTAACLQTVSVGNAGKNFLG